MLEVTIRLRSARTGDATEIGRIHIANQGTGTKTRGNYVAHIMRKGTQDKPQATVEIHDYPRLAYSVWELVRRVLNTSKKQLEASIGAEDLLAEQKVEALNRQELLTLQEDLKRLRDRCDGESKSTVSLQRTEALLMKLLGVFL